MRKLVFATGNAGKLRELRTMLGAGSGYPDALLADSSGLSEGFEVLSLDDFPDIESPDETGTTFEANARLKAQAFLAATGLPALADDSGLCVDALNGEPGVRSARYVEGTDADRVQHLLSVMQGVPDPERGAAFVCALCLALPDGRLIERQGEVRGVIGREVRGENGFGYDPVFLLPERGLTTAELPPAEKHAISHRGNALRALLPELVEALAR